MKSILIVGGGSAGWMAAAFLNHALRSPGEEGPLQITVVESDAIGTIGVGEATVPTMRTFLRSIGVPEWQFLTETHATFKHGIAFKGWRAPDAEGTPATYFHPFEVPATLAGHGLGTHWLNLRDRGFKQPPYVEAISVQPELSRRFKSPKPLSALPYESPLSYAYHTDASKFGEMLKKLAISRGVKHVSDKVVSVHHHENGDIAHVRTAEHGDLAADFFIDASGFRALLLGGALKEPFVDWTSHLLCDRAVACQLPHESEVPTLRPFTTSTAQVAGWIWEIDLFSRRGNGYVYSSQHASADEAETTLRAHLGESAKDAPVRHLSMQIGHRPRMWVHNCMALGLAAGFLEPLESTGIYLVEVALSLFIDHVGGGVASPHFAARFNRKMSDIYLEIRDFLQMHYILSDRDDSAFWRDYRNEVSVSDSLREKLALWAFKLPSITDLDGQMTLFGPANYSYILAGMNHLPAGANHLSPYIAQSSSIKALTLIEQAKAKFVNSLPSHYEFLKKTRSVA
jgi:tryptophan 7-halogenase